MANKEIHMQIETKCKTCGKTFEKLVEKPENSSEGICYNCALESLTKGRVPEEGDFNSAMIISGEISDQEREWLQQDLESIDRAACMPDPEEEEPHDDYSWLENRDDEDE